MKYQDLSELVKRRTLNTFINSITHLKLDKKGQRGLVEKLLIKKQLDYDLFGNQLMFANFFKSFKELI